MTDHPTFGPIFTYEEYASLPDDGNRYEVLDGEVLVTPAPSTRHQDVLARLTIALRLYTEQQRIGLLLPGVDLLFQPNQFLCPDLLYVPRSSFEGVSDRGIERAPGLVIEVLSPSSRSIDRVKKPRRYGDFGVPEYWVVDPKEEVVWIWRFARGTRDPERVTDRIAWHPEGAKEPFTMQLTELFAPMLPNYP